MSALDRFTDDTETPRVPARKDTKRWCKGREGHEHVLEIVIPENTPNFQRECKWVNTMGDEPYFSCVHAEVCTACGKQTRHSYGFLRDQDPRRHLIAERECPNYVPFPAQA
jgi:hypothetical protein